MNNYLLITSDTTSDYKQLLRNAKCTRLSTTLDSEVPTNLKEWDYSSDDDDDSSNDENFAPMTNYHKSV